MDHAATSSLSVRRWIDSALARGRDYDAEFEDLLETHYRHVYALIYRMVRNESDSADLTQETFVRIYRALPRLRATGASAAWVRRIATNLCVDFIRRRRARPVPISLDNSAVAENLLSAESLHASDEQSPTGHVLAQERVSRLHAAVDALPEDYRTVVVLHHIEDIPVNDIADALRVPPGTVKSRLSRARRVLYRRLGPYFAPASLRP